MKLIVHGVDVEVGSGVSVAMGVEVTTAVSVLTGVEVLVLVGGVVTVDVDVGKPIVGVAQPTAVKVSIKPLVRPAVLHEY